jgi:hypothetical protein
MRTSLAVAGLEMQLNMAAFFIENPAVMIAIWILVALGLMAVMA